MDLNKLRDEEKLVLCRRYFYGKSLSIPHLTYYNWFKLIKFYWLVRWICLFTVSLVDQLLLVLQNCIQADRHAKSGQNSKLRHLFRLRSARVDCNIGGLERIFSMESNHPEVGRWPHLCTTIRNSMICCSRFFDHSEYRLFRLLKLIKYVDKCQNTLKITDTVKIVHNNRNER